MEKTARPILIPFGVTPCGRDNNTSIPNNFFGSGELDIEAAINYCLDIGKNGLESSAVSEMTMTSDKTLVVDTFIKSVTGKVNETEMAQN